MKKLILALCALGAFSLANATEAIVAKKMTCGELKSAVNEAGSIMVRGFGKITVHATPTSCDKNWERAQKSWWRTKDKFACLAGYRCVDIHNSEK